MGVGVPVLFAFVPPPAAVFFFLDEGSKAPSSAGSALRFFESVGVWTGDEVVSEREEGQEMRDGLVKQEGNGRTQKRGIILLLLRPSRAYTITVHCITHPVLISRERKGTDEKEAKD